MKIDRRLENGRIYYLYNLKNGPRALVQVFYCAVVKCLRLSFTHYDN